MKVTRLAGAVLVGAAVTLFGCRDSEPLAPHPADLLFGPVGLLGCSPLPADSVTLTIGPEGGTLDVGAHRLTVPAGALFEPVAITAIAPTGTVNQVRFQPEGLVFARSAALTMSYANCDVLGSLLPKRVAYTSDALGILEYLPSIDNVFARRVTGRVQHFSTYAIAW